MEPFFDISLNVPENEKVSEMHKICDQCFTSVFLKFILLIPYLIQNSQAVKKECGSQKGYGEKRCEIQGGGQEMAVMVG